jgi:hypothetical protein
VNLIPYARVTLDGELLGETPIDREIKAGRHSLELENPDTGRRTKRTIDAEPDAEVQVTSW